MTTFTILSSMGLALALGGELAIAAPAGGPAYRVRDIDTRQSSTPTQLTDLNGRLFFASNDASSGPGLWLWQIDGPGAGIARLKTGPIAALGRAGDRLFFFMNDDDGGVELWTSDGSEAGTQWITGGIGAYYPPAELTEVGDALFFVAADHNGGRELWTSDGTAAGTVRLTDGVPLPLGTESMQLTDVGGTLFFVRFHVGDVGYYGEGGFELWKSDGTVAGTAPVRDFPHGRSYFFPDLAAVDGALFLTAFDPHGAGLWRSDGTLPGTELLRYVETFSPGGGELTEVAGTLLFAGSGDEAGLELWRSDGTEAGTERLTDLNPGAAFAHPFNLTELNGVLVFAAHDEQGVGLWRSDGTAAGTTLLERLAVPGFGPRFARAGDYVFFVAEVNGIPQLWRSDGTEAGTVQLTNLITLFAPTSLTAVGDTLYFVHDDGFSGAEIWRSNGTRATTLQVTDLGHDTLGSYPSALTNLDGTLLFVANDGRSGLELWRSNGTRAGTVQVSEINPTGDAFDTLPEELVATNGMVFFPADDGSSGLELWRSDGTEAGTVLVKDIVAGANGSGPFHLTAADGQVFFLAAAGSGPGLWKSDGTEDGTALLMESSFDATQGPLLCLPRLFQRPFCPPLVSANGRVFFLAATDRVLNSPLELWRTDGTIDGTERLSTLPGRFMSMRAAGDLLFLVMNVYDDERTTSILQLWATSTVGARIAPVERVVDLEPPASSVTDLMNVGGSLFFTLDDPSGLRGLWRSDGTADGTLRLRDIARHVDSSILPTRLTNAGGALFFEGYDDATGIELWRSDGTAAGTGPVADLAPGPDSAAPFELADADGVLYFTVAAGQIGAELWRSDGTAAGTAPVQDIAPGALSSYPSQLVAAGSHLFFTADDGHSGRELWALPLRSSCSGDCDLDGTVTIDELVTGLAMALDGSAAGACGALDTNRDDRVALGELVAAVRAALEGCA